jgi:predicted GNAT superfamily acetyltransferase
MFLPERFHTIRGRRFLLKVEDSFEASDYLKYEELRNAVWNVPEDGMSGSRNLMCENFLHEGSSLFLAAYAEDAAGSLSEDAAHLAGFSYGYVGIRDKSLGYRDPENLWFYSQYTAVRPGFEGFGLGILIKEFQRDVLLEMLGIGVVVCTCDPLTAVNAHRNVRHFRMDVLEYRVATYGEFGGRLNRADIPSDRFFMSWDLAGDAARRAEEPEDVPAAATKVITVETKKTAVRSGRLNMEIARGLSLERLGEFALVRIPRDFYLMLEETAVDDPDVRRIPVDWRTTTRQAFKELFGRGYRVVDFLSGGEPSPRCFYVLRKAGG